FHRDSQHFFSLCLYRELHEHTRSGDAALTLFSFFFSAAPAFLSLAW
ncbi:hypothetical protein CSUI_006551, partial [Cystoisospora suis]